MVVTPRRWVRAASLMVATAVAVALPAAAPAGAVEPEDWKAGMIISDAVFYRADSMSAAEIQTFLDAKGMDCQAGAVPCLKDYRLTTPTRPADAYCRQYAGASSETAAQVISKVGAACAINPQVLIVLIQKESSLVATNQPSEAMYQTATGYACPDTAACDARFFGFFNQVYSAAHRFNEYAANPDLFTVKAGQVNTIRYNPKASCGSSEVFVENQATANLYNYTPYQPNQAALDNLYGEGDECSAYGNRNFWRTMDDWFPVLPGTMTATKPTIPTSALVGQVLSADPGSWGPRGVSLAYQWLRDGVPIRDATQQRYKVTIYDQGRRLSVQVTGTLFGYTTTSLTSAVVVPRLVCHSFTDVPPASTFADAICWAYATGITTGSNAAGTTYSPANSVNRGAMAAFLYRLAGSPRWSPPAVSPFVDVATTHQFYSAITWLYAQKVTVGTVIGGRLYYQPANAVNRGSMAAFLRRLVGSPANTATANPFADLNRSTNQFYDSILWLASQKITVGTMVGGRLVYQSSNPVTRGSMAAFLRRLANTRLQCAVYANAVGC